MTSGFAYFIFLPSLRLKFAPMAVLEHSLKNYCAPAFLSYSSASYAAVVACAKWSDTIPNLEPGGFPWIAATALFNRTISGLSYFMVFTPFP